MATKKTPFKLRLKEILQNAAGLSALGGFSSLGVLFSGSAQNVMSKAFLICVVAGSFGGVCFYLSTKLKPKMRKWVAGGEYKDWTM